MAVYDLEEQETIDDLRAWWKQWGNYVTTAVLVVALALASVQGWRWWKASRAEQASALYSAVSTAVRGNDLAKAKDAVTELEARYAGTGYAPRAAMLLARMLFDAGDRPAARSQLQWVLDHADEDELRQIARYRLAEVQLDEKQYDDALRTLDARHDEAFTGIYADLRGDILAATGRAAEARSAYQTAVARLDPKSPYRSYVQVKLDALGGPVGAPVGAAPEAIAPTAPSAPPPAPAK
jgi:predicted negative regulator of RcsB-dependent stress response